MELDSQDGAKICFSIEYSMGLWCKQLLLRHKQSPSEAPCIDSETVQRNLEIVL